MRKKKGNKVAGLVMSSVLALTISASAVVTPAFASGTSWGNGKYYSSYDSYAELLEAVGEVNLQAAEEGQVLLKNDGTLPLTGRERVSVFGAASSTTISGPSSGDAYWKYTDQYDEDYTVSDKGPIYDSLESAGFKVNPTLASFYADQGFSTGNCGQETTEFGDKVSNSINLYNDVGVIVLARYGGEGSDLDLITDEPEDNDYLGKEQGWEHEALYKGTYAKSASSGGGFPGMGSTSHDVATTSKNHDEENGTEYKHYLQLTEEEEDLIQYVETHCKKVIVVLNTSNAMECYNLREDPEINGILLMGRGGDTGHMAVGEILAGLVNPSGKLVDEWNTDFTADPTWNNYSWNDQTGSSNMYYNGTYGTGLYGYTGNGNYDDHLTRGKEGDTTTTFGGGTEAVTQITYGSHNQNAYYGTDYEEDIYLGYAYWETKYYELYQALLKYESVMYATNAGNKTINRNAYEGATDQEKAANAANIWWEKNVTFAFGSGLSYTTFSFNIDANNIIAYGGALESEDEKRVSDFNIATSMTTENLSSSANAPAKIKTLYIPVTVTNTGSVAGKQTVEIYVTAPYDSTNAKLEKSFVTLVGYAKTEILNPGQSETVYAQVNVQDMASFDYSNAYGSANDTGYTLDAGEYTIRAMNTSHYDVATSTADKEDAYDEVKFTVGTAGNSETRAQLLLDDFSGNVSTALFSDSYNSEEVKKYVNGNVWAEDTDENHYQVYNSLRTANLMADGTSKEVLLTRSTMLSYFPEAPTQGDLTFSTSYVTHLDYWNQFSASDQAGDDWYKTAEDCVDEEGNAWKQNQGSKGTNYSTTGLYDILLSDMAGVELFGKDSNGEKVMTTEWSRFMDQLTVEEMTKIIRKSNNMWRSTGISTIGKAANQQKDSYNNNGDTLLWVDAPTITATWNSDLQYKIGQVRGNLSLYNGWSAWGGPEMDTHRSPFSGRNFEYLSQDGIVGGYTAAMLTSGMQSVGVTTYVKHFAFNDQETCRDGMENMVWLSEQTARQIYLKVFQMAMQEGGSKSSMTGFARLAGIPTSSNNQLMENMVCDQWGWDGMFITDGYSGFSRCTTMASMMRSYVVPLPLKSIIPSISGYYDETANKFYAYTGAWDTELEGTPSAANSAITADSTQKHIGVTTDSSGKYYVGIDDEGNEEYAAGGFVGTEKESYTQWYYLRMLAARILHVEANSLTNLNGHSLTTLPTLAETDATVKQGSSANIDLGVTGAAKSCYDTTTDKDGNTVTTENFTAEYEIADGELPAGLTLNSSTGIISGTPTEAGTYTFSVSVTLDGWVNTTLVNDDRKPTNGNLTKSYTITVESAFYLADENAAKITNFDVTAGNEFAAEIKSDTVTASGTETIKYSIESGELPAGLTLGEDGTITGTIASTAKNGTYDVVIKIAKSTTSSGGNQGGWPGGGWPGGGWGGQGGGNSSTNYTYALSFNVTGGQTETVAKTVANVVKGEAGLVITYSDGTTNTISESESETVRAIASITKNAEGNLVITDTTGKAETITIASTSTGSAETVKAIASITKNSEGNLVITDTEGQSTTITIDSTSSTGTDKAITSIIKNDEGNLVITDTEGKSETLEIAKAEASDSGCNSSVSGTQALLIALPVLAIAAAAVAISHKKKDEDK